MNLRNTINFLSVLFFCPCWSSLASITHDEGKGRSKYRWTTSETSSSGPPENKQQNSLQIHIRTIRQSSPFVCSPGSRWLTSISLTLKLTKRTTVASARNKHGQYYVFIEAAFVVFDDSTSMGFKWEGERRGGRQHKGSLFSRRDKSEVSFWIFNILKGTKQSYSGLVSEFSPPFLSRGV